MNSRVEPRVGSRSSLPSLRDALNGLALWCLLLLTGIGLGPDEHVDALQEALPGAQVFGEGLESPNSLLLSGVEIQPECSEACVYVADLQ